MQAALLAGYAMVYIFMQTFAMPGTVSLSLLSGALYGVVRGLLLVAGVHNHTEPQHKLAKRPQLDIGQHCDTITPVISEYNAWHACSYIKKDACEQPCKGSVHVLPLSLEEARSAW